MQQILAHRSRAPIAFEQLQMLAVELHALVAAVFVDLQPERQMHAGTLAQAGIVGRSADMSKRNGIQAGAETGLRSPQLQLQMPAAYDASLGHFEFAVEHRLGKSLPPGARPAERARRIDAELLTAPGTLGI